MTDDLTPPDMQHCQCDVPALTHTPFSLGPRMSRLCGEKPIWLAVEVVPGSDGRCGAMSLCQAHAEALMVTRSFRDRVQLQPILDGEIQVGPVVRSKRKTVLEAGK
jgi:hypothetical protein